MRTKYIKEKGTELVFLIPALTSILAAAAVCIFLLANGMSVIGKIGIFKFLVGGTQKPGNNVHGILSMILGSIYATAGATLVNVPIGILTAVFVTKFCPKWLYEVMKPAVNLLVGIPLVVYGSSGLVVIVSVTSDLSGGGRKNIATASVLLGIMILPAITGVSESAIGAVLDSYYEGALVLGISRERGVFFATLPVAKLGILAGAILGIGQAIGKTMAVIVVVDNQPRVSKGTFQDVRALTANIAVEMGYVADLHRGASIAAVVVLFVFVLLIDLSFSVLSRKAE